MEAKKAKLVDDAIVLCHMASLGNRSAMDEIREKCGLVGQLFVDPV